MTKVGLNCSCFWRWRGFLTLLVESFLSVVRSEKVVVMSTLNATNVGAEVWRSAFNYRKSSSRRWRRMERAANFVPQRSLSGTSGFPTLLYILRTVEDHLPWAPHLWRRNKSPSISWSSAVQFTFGSGLLPENYLLSCCGQVHSATPQLSLSWEIALRINTTSSSSCGLKLSQYHIYFKLEFEIVTIPHLI